MTPTLTILTQVTTAMTRRSRGKRPRKKRRKLRPQQLLKLQHKLKVSSLLLNRPLEVSAWFPKLADHLLQTNLLRLNNSNSLSKPKAQV